MILWRAQKSLSRGTPTSCGSVHTHIRIQYGNEFESSWVDVSCFFSSELTLHSFFIRGEESEYGSTSSSSFTVQTVEELEEEGTSSACTAGVGRLGLIWMPGEEEREEVERAASSCTCGTGTTVIERRAATCTRKISRVSNQGASFDDDCPYLPYLWWFHL